MQAAENLSITLPAEMARAIRAKVANGSYGSNSEVIREAMREWLERERALGVLSAAIDRGIADADTGRLAKSEQMRAALLERVRKGRQPAT